MNIFCNYYAHNLPTWNFSPDQLIEVLYGLVGHNMVLGDMKIAQDLVAQCPILAEKTQDRPSSWKAVE